MNQKNYFFLICFAMVNTYFAMENNSVCDFQNAYNKIKEAFAANDVSLLVDPLNFFSTVAVDQSIEEMMRGLPSPLLYNIQYIAQLNKKIDNCNNIKQNVSLPTVDQISTYQVLLKEKEYQFQLLKVLCTQFPLFFSNQWNTQETTPLIYACSYPNMEEEVKLLLMYSPHLSGTTNEEYKIALEKAAGLNHQSIVELLNNTIAGNSRSVSPVHRGSFFSTLNKKGLEKQREKLVHAIELSDITKFKEITENNEINFNDEYCHANYGTIPLIAIALNQYFLQQELFQKIIPQKEDTSQTLKKQVFAWQRAAQTILFDIIEKKPNLNIDYIHPVTNEVMRGEDNSSTPLKEAIRRNARSVIAHLLEYNADPYYKGSNEDAVTPFELASQSSHVDLLNYLTKISGVEEIIPLETQNDQPSERERRSED